jgi:hypothetical protein
VHDPSLVNAYQFGTKTADFHVCTRCGVVPFVTCRIDNVLYGLVNVNALDASARALVKRAPVSHEETTQERLARRQRNWIRDVRIE